MDPFYLRAGHPKKRVPVPVIIGCLVVVGAFAPQAGNVSVLTSPDGRIRASIEMPKPGSTARPQWSATFRGRAILSECGLGLQTADSGDLMVGVRVVRERRRFVDELVPVLFGKSARAQDRFREVRFTLETPRGRRTDVVFRCYDDAVALRYELPATQEKAALVTITDEATTFRLEGEPMAFVQYLEDYKTSHEHNVIRTRYRDIKPNGLLDLPLTFSWEDNTYVAITEAALRHYAGMCLSLVSGKSGAALTSRLTPREDGTKVVRSLPLHTPWRVVMIGDRPGSLLESQTLYCLNEPSRIKDVSWIKPDKITFPWWNGDVYDGQPGPPVLSFEMASKYIDFCAGNGLSIHSLTSTETTVTPWYYQSKPGVEPGPDTDVTRPRAEFDLPAIRRYAQSKQVRLWTWVHQRALRGRVARLKKWVGAG